MGSLHNTWNQKTSMMWQHPSYQTAKAFKEMPSVKKNTVTLFWEHRGTLLVNFLDHGTHQLLSIAVIHWRCQSRPSAAKCVVCHAKVSYALLANQTCDFIWCYSWEVMGNLPIVLISCTLISISLDYSRSTWLACDMQYILTSSKLWPSG